MLPSGNAVATPTLSYLNLVHGIHLDYPASWQVREQATPSVFIVVFGSPSEGPSDLYQENLTITLQPLFAGVTQDAFIKSWQTMAQQAGFVILQTLTSTVAGRPAFQVTFNTPAAASFAGQVMGYLFVSNNIGYTIAYTAQAGHFATFLPAVQQMLGTLQLSTPNHQAIP